MSLQKQVQGPRMCGVLAAAGIWLGITATGGLFAAAPEPAPPASAAYDPNNPPAGVFEEDWMEVKLDGQKAGYMYNLLRRQGDRVFSEQRAVMKLARMGIVLEVQIESATEETVAGEPRAFRSLTKTAAQPTLVEGKGDGQNFTVNYQSGNYREQKRIALPAGTVMAWGMERQSLLHGLKAGTHYTLLGYAPEDDWTKPMPVDVTVVGPEKIQAHGQPFTATRVETVMKTGQNSSGVKTTMWVDAGGRTIKSRQSLGGMELEMTETTQALALADYLPADIFITTMIQLAQPVPETAASVTYRLKRKSGEALPAPPTSAAQQSEVLPDGTQRVTLSRGGNRPAPATNPQLDPAPYLARNGFLDTQDTLLKKLAAEGGGPANAPAAVVAGRLRDFVREYIRDKNLGVGFATAAEVALRREGDCTEHAVLLAALGRIRGLPTRVMAGLAYLPEYEGKKWVLGYHMWAQFYLDGQWVDFDAALPDGAGPPRRLGLRASDLNDTSLADFSLGLMEWMGDLQVTVESPAAARNPRG